MENLTLIALTLIAGLLLQRVAAFHAAPQILNQYVIYVALPALIFLNLPRLEFSWALLVPMLVPWALLVLSVGVILLLNRVYHWSRGTLGALLLVVPLGNTSFLGFPMVEALLGGEGVPYAVVFDQLGSFLILSFYAPFLISLLSEGQDFHWHRVFKKVAVFPPFVALAFTLVLIPLDKPLWLIHNVQRIADTLVPVAMIAVGLQLKFRFERHLFTPILWGFSIKLLLMPLAALLVLGFLGQSGLIMQVTVLEAAMPAMITAGAIATSANFNPPLAAALVAWGVILSLITLPIWAWVLQWS